jgi:hypothetical protein
MLPCTSSSALLGRNSSDSLKTFSGKDSDPISIQHFHNCLIYLIEQQNDVRTSGSVYKFVNFVSVELIAEIVPEVLSLDAFEDFILKEGSK